MQDLSVAEYWLIEHPPQQQITGLELQHGIYQELGVFCTSDRILSPTFRDLTLTAAQVLAAGK